MAFNTPDTISYISTKQSPKLNGINESSAYTTNRLTSDSLYDQQICPLCIESKPSHAFPSQPVCLSPIVHTEVPCIDCLLYFFTNCIHEYRHVSCPTCEYDINYYVLVALLSDTLEHRLLSQQYDRRLLDQCLRKNRHAKFCPEPDCSYALILLNSRLCPQVQCGICHKYFCGMCEQPAHMGQSCQEARFSIDTRLLDSTRKCPKCHAIIEKVDDGSCNFLVCQICGSKFCWLCGKETSEMHFWSPSGCTYFGSKKWDDNRRDCCQIALLLFAPLFIFLLSFVALPVILIGFPIITGYAIHETTIKRRIIKIPLLITLVCLASFFGPFIYLLFIVIGIPLLYLFCYIVIPIYLCKKGLCLYCCKHYSNTNNTDDSFDSND